MTDQPDQDTPPEPEQLHAIVSGIVQGVSFRYYTQREAARLKLIGWVKNNADGTVETVAQGSRAALEEFEQFLHQGPRAAWVESVEVTYSTAEGAFRGFNIRY